MFTHVYAMLFYSIIIIIETHTMDDVHDSDQCYCMRIVRHPYVCNGIIHNEYDVCSTR